MTTTRDRMKKLTPKQRLKVFRDQAARQEKAAVELLRIVDTAQAIELDGIENLVARSVAFGAITTGRAAGIRDMIRGRRRKLAKRTEAQ